MLPFQIYGKKVSENQLRRLIAKGCTTNLKGFTINGEKKEGLVRFGDQHTLVFEPKKGTGSTKTTKKNDNSPLCPKCKKGTIIKGKTAYGCSNWKSGCDFQFSFGKIKEAAAGRKLTKELVMAIISG